MITCDIKRNKEEGKARNEVGWYPGPARVGIVCIHREGRSYLHKQATGFQPRPPACGLQGAVGRGRGGGREEQSPQNRTPACRASEPSSVSVGRALVRSGCLPHQTVRSGAGLAESLAKWVLSGEEEQRCVWGGSGNLPGCCASGFSGMGRCSV